MTKAIEGEIVQTSSTPFGQQFKVDWLIPEKKEKTILRTIWKIRSLSTTPRLVSAFIK
ncbi:MAG: DUF6883 domain-containing protein [Cyanobacteria bacterium J06627_28]